MSYLMNTHTAIANPWSVDDVSFADQALVNRRLAECGGNGDSWSDDTVGMDLAFGVLKAVHPMDAVFKTLKRARRAARAKNAGAQK